MVSTSEVEGLCDSGTPLLYVYMQMFLFIITLLQLLYIYCNRHSSLFYYLGFVGGLETFLKNLSSVWDIFHVGFLASCSAPCGCSNNSIAVVNGIATPNLFLQLTSELEEYAHEVVK